MTDRFDPPSFRRREDDPAKRFAEVVVEGRIRAGSPWDQYLADPDLSRLGICCSGGGVRSASYAMGALQVLRRNKLLGEAAHLASVSGGGYSTVAHAIMVNQTEAQAHRQAGSGSAADSFAELAPWAHGSPEEQHLKNHTTYLAPGLKGKLWLALSALYGMIRHLVPFAAWVTLAGALVGVAFSRWIGPTLRETPRRAPVSTAPGLWALAGVTVLLGAVLIWRQHVATHKARVSSLARYQRWAVRLLVAQLAVAAFLLGLPALLLWIHSHDLYRSLPSKAVVISTAGGGSLGLWGALSLLLKRGAKTTWGKAALAKLAPLAVYLIAPVVVGLPFVAVTYFVTRRANAVFWPLVLTALPAALILIYWYVLDETTSNAHLFYRERLATAFVGFRSRKVEGPRGQEHTELGWGEPEWEDPILLSKLDPSNGGARPAGAESVPENARLPNLVVCAAVAISDDVVPPGRLAAPFTFERDYSGGPLTGYVPTELLEKASGPGVLTLPALMAISGAALSPTMGKMTRPWARFLLAVFNARLGVWVPNPLRLGPRLSEGKLERRPKGNRTLAPEEVRRRRGEVGGAAWEDRAEPELSAVMSVRGRLRRPGLLYIVREAFGLNRLGDHYMYVTDGGHWENLGLVELLRRGCGQILCFDAAGDDIEHFHTLSEAIELARSDLGVEIDIDLKWLRPDPVTKVSERPFAVGTITFPDRQRGVLVFAKAAMDKNAPQDCKDYRERVPIFPAHGTIDQLFDDRKFESYRALGAHAAAGASAALIEWRKAHRAAAGGTGEAAAGETKKGGFVDRLRTGRVRPTTRGRR